MSRDIGSQLKGSRADVEAARQALESTFRDIAAGLKRGQDASFPFRYELSVLRHLCDAVNESPQHADLFCDIVGILLPHATPFAEKPSLWGSHLSCLRYIHHTLCQAKSIAACQRLYELIRSQPCLLQEDSDYKYYLDIHLTHFHSVHLLLQKQALPLDATHQLCFALDALGDLFRTMRQRRMAETQPLLGKLNDVLLGKRSASFLKSLSLLPSESLGRMFEPLIKLLAGSSLAEPAAFLADYLSFLLALVQIDLQSPHPSLQLALQALRASRELFQGDSNIGYALQLIYCLLKLVYARGATTDFKRTYMDICRKCQLFLERVCGTHAKEQWLADLVVALQRLQALIHQRDSMSASPLQLFWQQLEGEGSAQAYAAHFKMLHSCAVASTNVAKSPLGNCSSEGCTSFRRHCILGFALCALDAYINWQPTEEQKADRSPHKPLMQVVVYAMQAAQSLKCLGPTSIELVKLVRQLTHVAHQVSCAEQASLLFALLEPLQQLRPSLDEKEMAGFLRRLVKASNHCKDPQMAGRMYACYLASLTNPVRLRSQISVYYHGQAKEGKEVQKCVYEWQKSCPLSYPLSSAQAKQFFDTDLFVVLHNLRKPSPAHLQSLASCRMSDYHFVLLSRQMSKDELVVSELRQISSRAKAQHPQNRMQQLALGHASVELLVQALESQKNKVSSKDTNENVLEEVLLRQNFAEMNIQREQRLVSLARDAVAAFEYFFSKADSEPLGVGETQIDWEALMDDAKNTAITLSSMGYQRPADDAWLLLLRIARLLEDRFTYLRALTHFLAQNEIDKRLDLDIAKEVDWAEDLLDDLWPQLHNGRYFMRHQTTVMICLCHLAAYYARGGCASTAELLLLKVEQLRDEYPERLGKSDIVLITLKTVRFRLNYQQQRAWNPRTPTPLRQLDRLLEHVRTFASLSSVDAGSLQLLLIALLRESTECSANRLSERLQFSNVVLQMSLQSGFVLQTIEVCLAWMWTNLQMEHLDKAQSKLRLIEHCLNIKPLSERVGPPAVDQAKDPVVTDLTSNMLLMQLVEPIRKQQQLDVASPKRLDMRSNSPSFQLNLDRYLNLMEAPPIIRKNPQLRCQYFIFGCLHARLCFLQRSDEHLDEFYAGADNWLSENPELIPDLGSMVQMQHVYKVNYLRYRKRYAEAASMAQKGLQMRQLPMDINYSYNLWAQLKLAQLEMKPVKPQCQKSRRALVFHLSPERKLRPALAAAPRVKQSAKKAPKFKIFTELELRPPNSDSVSSAGSGGSGNENTPPSDHVDLNACQPIEISDDDDSPTTLPLQRSKAQAKTRAKARAPAKPTVSEDIQLDDSTECVPTVPTKTTRARSRQPEETPKAAVLSSRRPRRKVVEKPPETEPASTRRRHRN
ncbi:hypothetical protein KR018_003411 [Drosophila ironensis]|nr:hypothetical protein KR018_003411 [Drosophila ironensis]